MKKTVVTAFILTMLALSLVFSASLLSHPGPIAAQGGSLAPAGDPGQTYYAPFPVSVTLDGDLSEWADVPMVTVSGTADEDGNVPGFTFAAAADDTYLYFMADVADANIISGQHGTDYWNEDSVEFYINATGNLLLHTYQDGVAQITVPAMNMDLPVDQRALGGVRVETTGAQSAVARTDTGWAAEVAVPLVNDVWTITPEHGGVLGFQAHLNGASTANRDTKLIWSVYDTSDRSYLDPSLFGQLIFYAVGQTDRPAPVSTEPTPKPPKVDTTALYYLDSMPIKARVTDLLSRMTLDEKIGQMTLVEKDSIYPSDITDLGIGGLLSGGGGSPTPNTPEAWAEMVSNFQSYALDSRLGIPLIYGVDAVHGHNNLMGAVIFPQEIGLGAANDPDLMTRIGQVTAQEMIATGIYWDYAPVIAVPQDIRWGRTYEAYGENTDLVSELGTAYLIGLQGSTWTDLSDPLTVLGTPKHYLGDGGTTWGSSTTPGYMLDQGDMQVDEDTLRALYLPPYQAAVDAGAMSIMVSFSSWNGTKMHAEKYLVTDVLKGELGFRGFVVSDWGGVDQIDPDYYTAVVAAINAGVDMNMVPYDYGRFISTMKDAVDKGDISLERIDDAVSRILTVKFALGLFERPFGQDALQSAVGSKEHRALAREAVGKSLVLLKNSDDVLPLAADTPVIYVAGAAADDIGIQSGGWTITWQGSSGDITPGTTILEAIGATVSDETAIVYSASGTFSPVTDADGNPLVPDVCIAVAGERPYAEGQGDDGKLTLPSGDLRMLRAMRGTCDTLVVVLISGRPMIITDLIDDWDAVVAAWLPGTEGQGVADGLFGLRPITGKLSYTWPRSVDQLPLGSGTGDPLFPFGYGLETAGDAPPDVIVTTPELPAPDANAGS